MPQCPFCRGKVEDDLIRFGGNCPHCLIEVPGEEAPTDPGVQAKAQMVAEQKAARRSPVPMVLAALLFVGVAGAGSAWYLLQPAPTEVATETGTFTIIPMSEHKDMELPEPVAEEQVAAAQPRAVSPTGGRSSSAPTTTTTPTGGTVTTQETAPQKASVASSGTAASGDLTDPLSAFSGPSVSVANKQPEGIVLKDMSQIEQMVGTGMAQIGKQFKRCYESELKTNPDLAGSWNVDFVIQKSGVPTMVTVKAQTVANPALESCMGRKVKDYRFQAIFEPFGIGQNFQFGPGF